MNEEYNNPADLDSIKFLISEILKGKELVCINKSNPADVWEVSGINFQIAAVVQNLRAGMHEGLTYKVAPAKVKTTKAWHWLIQTHDGTWFMTSKPSSKCPEGWASSHLYYRLKQTETEIEVEE